jgi:ribose transport system substrate-binding protein
MYSLRKLCMGLLPGILLISSFPSYAADKKERTIGFTVYSMTSWVTWGKKGVDTIAQDTGTKVLWNSADDDVSKQISQIQQFINQKVDAIVIAAVNSSTLAPQIEAANKAGIPVIATNMRIDGPAGQLLKAYVGPNDVGAGEGAAQSVVDVIGGKGGVVVLQGPIGQSAETDRTKGVKNILEKNPDVKLLSIQPANWDRTKAYNLMLDWLSRYGSDIKGVIAENDDMGVGATRALQEKGLAGKIPVGGVDAIKDGLREVKSGDFVATNLQNAAIELGMALQVTLDVLDGKSVPKTALLNMPVIKKDRVDYFYQQLYVKPDDFLKTLPELVRKNLASNDYANQ